MMKLEILSQVILNHIYMNPARIKTLCGMVFGMLQTGKSMQKSMAEGIESGATMESKIRRIQRLLKEQVIEFTASGRIILELLNYIGKYKLVLDRTNWKFGKTNINYFVVGIVIQKTAIPICWMLLDKKGNSSIVERIQLMEMLFEIIDPKQIECLLGDREFIGEKWFEWLNSKGIPFVIRVKENFVVQNKETGTRTPLSSFFGTLKTEKTKHVIVNLLGEDRTVAVKRLKDGELLILVTNYSFLEEEIFDLYRKRWGIETIFKALKTKGFNIEGTHMIDHEKLSKLFLIATLAAVISIKSGLIRYLEKPIIVKNHGRRLFSLFTYGFDFLRFNLFTKTSQCLDRFLKKAFQLSVS